MNPEDIYAILGDDFKAVKDLIHNRLSSQVALLDSVNEGLLANSGKMARPTLCLLMARACGGCTEDTRLFAASVEILHNSTLLHDDVADQSDTRRGVPTVMSLYGPVPAVLVGDFWLSRAVDLVLDASHSTWAIRACAKVLTDLSEGEMLQQERSFKCDTTEEDYLKIIYCKTASLFELSCTSAAKSVDASPEFFSAASRYGKALGMAFQIRDDILDYTGSDLGKPVGLDLRERKIPLPLLGALKGCSDPAAVRRKVNEIPEHPEYQTELAGFVRSEGGIEYAQGVLHDYISTAIGALSPLPPSREKEYLKQFALLNELRTK